MLRQNVSYFVCVCFSFFFGASVTEQKKAPNLLNVQYTLLKNIALLHSLVNWCCMTGCYLLWHTKTCL